MGLRIELTNNGPVNAAAIQAAVAEGLNRGAEYVATQALPLTPMVEGDLRGTQQVHEASAGDLEADVSYDSVYAVYQHEGVGFHHTEPGTQAKYLEQPFNESKDAVLQMIAAAVKGAL